MSSYRPVPTGILQEPLTRVAVFAQRFKVSDECWEWQARKSKKGYGLFATRGRDRFAHRIMWELAGLPVNYDLEVNHKCDNPPCVNPKHLEQVTSEDNQAYRKNQPTCRRGHPREGSMVVYDNGNGKQSRRCKACARIRGRAFYRKTRRNSSSMTSSATPLL